jgi:hypothetical protein
VAGEDDNGSLRALSPDRGRRLEAVHIRQTDVHQNDIRTQHLCLLDRFAPGGRFADDLDARIVKHHAHSGALQFMVVDDKHRDLP